MYVIIGLNTYTSIRNLSFAPETDVTALSVPINQFVVEISADASLIDYGMSAELYDDLDNLWASYVVVNAEDIGAGMVRVTAQSVISKLEYRDMAAVMYSAEPIADVLALIFEDIPGTYSLDNSYSSATITGYCPEQTARDRLTWVCFALGAYVKTYMTDKIDILPVPDTDVLVPLNQTFYRPSISEGEYVTAIKVTAFTFTQNAQAWENDDNSYRFPLPWTATEQSMTLANSSAPQDAPENVIEVDELYLVNSSNVSAILTRLAQYYFKRTKVQLDCINNAQFEPGQLAVVYTSKDDLMGGYIRSAAFRFGKQARSTLELIASTARTGANLTINYLYNNGRIGQNTYKLPVGYTYSIQNPYFDREYDGHRFIYRPVNDNATGTIASGDNTDNEDYAIALEGYDAILRIVSVDSIEVTTSGGEYVGVIA